MLEAHDPATGELVSRHAPHTRAELDRRLDRARATVAARAPLDERRRWLASAAARLDAGTATYATLMAREMGKPVAQGHAEVAKCARTLRHYAEHAAAMLAPRPVAVESGRAEIRLDPLGAILAVMPWNFPFWQVVRCAAPMLAAGDALLLKHAPTVPGCALALEEVFADAGGAFAALLVDDDAVTAELIADPRVAGATVTGSARAGAAVAAQAGRHLKKTVLELGGSDPFIVLADADVARAAEIGAAARLQNGGQSCIAAKRFIVDRAVADAFTAHFIERLRAARVGSPLDPATDVGPLARRDLRDTLQQQVEASVARGARVVLGGAPLPGPGWFYPPTLLVDAGPGMPAWDEETFGPLAALAVVDGDDDALAAANASELGLGAAVFTADPSRARRFAAGLEAGSVFVNRMVASDARLPFGGVKRSGYGRELSQAGVDEWCNLKTVWIDGSAAATP